MKKVLKFPLIVVLVLVGLCIVGTAVMFFFNLCPPQGPWPMPPWCAGEGGQPGGQGRDDMGCFPPSCALIRDEAGRKFCEEWKNGVDVWPVDYCNVGSAACVSLCESDNARIPGKIVSIGSKST
jgi:hypothetical protein